MVISTRMGSHVSDITPHSKEWKTALTLLEEVESSGEMWHFLAQLFCSVLRTLYELLPEQHWRLDGYLMHPIHYTHIPRPSGTVLTTIWEAYEPPCFHRDTWTVSPTRGTFPQHSRFSAFRCGHFVTEPETWPLLPPCG